MQVTLTGPVNRDQLFKIQEVLRHPLQYRDKLPPNEQLVTGEYAKSFNTFKINNTPFTQSFIVCRHMTRHMILGTDFTAMNFMGVIWTREGMQKLCIPMERLS